MTSFFGDYRHFFNAQQTSSAANKEAPSVDEGKGWFTSSRSHSSHNLRDSPIPYLLEKRAQHGDVFRLKLGTMPTTMVLNPDASFLRRFFLANENDLGLFKTLMARGILIPFAGEGLPDRSTCRFVFYKTMPILRRKLVPAVSKQSLANEFDDAFRQLLDEMDDEGTIDSHEFVTRAVFRMTSQALLGSQFEEDEDRFIALIEQLVDLVSRSERSSMVGWPRIIYSAGKLHREFRDILEPIIQERRSWQKEKPDGWLEKHELHDLLSYLLDACPGGVDDLTADQVESGIRMALITALYGAFANTVSSIEGTLLSILADTNIYNEVVDDISSGFRDLAEDHRTLADISLKDFPFVHACFMEFLRMNPSTFLTRLVEKEPLKLPGGFEAKVGTMVAIAPWIMMRDPNLFDDPHTFDPYRVFEDSWDEAERNLQFLSFGQGKHKCKGMNLAFQQMKVSLCTVLREYRLELAEPFPGIPEPSGSYVPSPNRSVGIKYSKRIFPLGFDFFAFHAPLTPCSKIEESHDDDELYV